MVGTDAGRLGAVWSHLLLCEAIAEERPARFIDESARLPLSPLVMDEPRLFGIGRLLRAATTVPELNATGFMDAFAGANELAPALSYPQPILQAMLVSQGAGTQFLAYVRDETSSRFVMALARRIGHGQRCLCVQTELDDPMQELLARKARETQHARMAYLGSLAEPDKDPERRLETLCNRDDDGEMVWLEAPFRDGEARTHLLARIEATRKRARGGASWWIAELRGGPARAAGSGINAHSGCLLVATGLQESTRSWLTCVSRRLSEACCDTRLPDGSGDVQFSVLRDGPPAGVTDGPAYRRRPGPGIAPGAPLG